LCEIYQQDYSSILAFTICAGLAFTGGETGTTEWKPGETIRLKIRDGIKE